MLLLFTMGAAKYVVTIIMLARTKSAVCYLFILAITKYPHILLKRKRATSSVQVVLVL